MKIRKLSKQEKDEKIKGVKMTFPQIEDKIADYPEHQKQFFLQLARNLKKQIQTDLE